MIPAFNFKRSGGQFDMSVRLLQTFTIHLNETTGCYVVRDDRKSDALVSAGWGSLEKAVAAHQWEDDKRVLA